MRKKIFDIIEMDEHNDLSSRLYDKFMYATIAISIIPLMFRTQNMVFTIVEYVVSFIFVVDYILRWITADYRSRKKGILPFLLYPFTLIAIIDLLSLLPTISLFNSSLRVFRTWRLLRLLRIVKVFKYYEPLQIVIEVFHKKSAVLLTVVGFAFFYIFVTALIMFNVERGVDPESGKMFFENFFDALYWSTCTLTTVGYGDIYPVTGFGRLVSMLSAMVGIAIIALPSGIITAGYMEEVNERKAKKESNDKDL